MEAGSCIWTDRCGQLGTFTVVKGSMAASEEDGLSDHTQAASSLSPPLARTQRNSSIVSVRLPLRAKPDISVPLR